MSNYSLPNYAEVKDHLVAMPEDADVVEAYESGFVGAYHDPEGDERAMDIVAREGMPTEFGDIASAGGFAGQAKSGIYLLHKEVERAGLRVDTIGYVSQPCGNCVSRGTQNALLHTLCAAVNAGEGSIPPEAFEASKVRCNPVSSEVNYWWKWSGSRAGGDGWHASACLAAAKEHAGLVWRADFRSIGGPDLRTETRSTAHAWGSAGIPDKFREVAHRNPLKTYARVRGIEEIADAISAGYAVQTDGGEGWSKSTDENGYSRQTGRWSHSMCITGVVTTDAAKRKYNTAGLVMIQNSWGAWNHNQDAHVMGTDIKLPPGAFFAKWEDCTRRSFYSVSSVTGWPNRKLKSWDITDLI